MQCNIDLRSCDDASALGDGGSGCCGLTVLILPGRCPISFYQFRLPFCISMQCCSKMFAQICPWFQTCCWVLKWGGWWWCSGWFGHSDCSNHLTVVSISLRNSLCLRPTFTLPNNACHEHNWSWPSSTTVNNACSDTKLMILNGLLFI